MNNIEANEQASSQTRAAAMPLIAWDFLKMFTAAVIYGVCISLVAAGIALFLAADADASRATFAEAYRTPFSPPAPATAASGEKLQNRI
jgi:hypothetical protein